MYKCELSKFSELFFSAEKSTLQWCDKEDNAEGHYIFSWYDPKYIFTHACSSKSLQMSEDKIHQEPTSNEMELG